MRALPGHWKGLLLVLLIQLLFLAGTRSLSPAGWGWGKTAGDSIGVGWVANGPDSYSYGSWAQQAANGHALMSILFSATPHRDLYFNPVLLTAGTLGRSLGGRVEGWLVLMGTLAALALTVLIHRCAHELGLGSRAAGWAAAACALGSGWSWCIKILNALLSRDIDRAADLRFMDMLPSSTALVYPLHACAQALLGLILYLLLRTELRLFRAGESGMPPRLPPWEALLLSLGCMLLAASRPYEPAVLLAAYGGYLGFLAVETRSPRPFLNRLIPCLILGSCTLPFIAYSAWVSKQPVWNNFAAMSLLLGHPRLFWLAGFGGLWVLGLLGARILWKSGNRAARFPVLWTLGGAFLLLVLDVQQSKLASGMALSLSLCAGVGMAWSLKWIAGFHGKTLRRIALTLGLAGLASPLTLLVLARECVKFAPVAEAEVVRMAELLRVDLGASRRPVLCSSELGGLLPGLAGIRVYTGHWSLTDDFEGKVQRLSRIGLERDGAAGFKEELLRLAAELGTPWIALATDRPLHAELTADPAFLKISTGKHWTLFRLTEMPKLSP